MTATGTTDSSAATSEPPAPELPPKPGPSWFAIGGTIGAIAMTIVTARAVEFSFGDVWANLSRQNSVIEGALDPDWGQLWSERSRSAFLETLLAPSAP
mgnify:CR=1 FL=1